MDRFLECPELVRYVCRYASCLVQLTWLRMELGPLGPTARKALASLALTCRAFSQPATEELWSRVVYNDKILLLIAELLPAGLIEREDGNPRLRGEITEKDMTFLKNRARYIRELAFNVPVLERTSATFEAFVRSMEVSIVPQDYPLFPRLRKITITGPQPQSTSHIHFILSPSVVDVTIGGLDLANPIARALVTGIGRACPHMVKFDVAGTLPRGDAPSLATQCIINVTQGWGALQSIALHSPELPTLKALSHLPNLKDAAFLDIPPIPYAGLSFLDSDDGGGYASLQSLHMNTGTPLQASCAQVIKLLHRSPVRTLQIEFGSYDDDLQSFQDIIRLLPKHIDHASLKNLNVFEDSFGDKPWTDDYIKEGMSPPDDPYNLALLHPFRELSSIMIMLRYAFSVGKNVLEPLCAHLPHLKSLELGCTSRSIRCFPEGSMNLKLYDLVDIGRASPELERLQVLMDASDLDQSPARPGRGFQHTKLKSLSVVRSPLDSVQSAVVFLSDVFPQLQFVHANEVSAIPRDGVGQASRAEEPLYKRWQQVSNMIQVASYIRAQEREWASDVRR